MKFNPKRNRFHYGNGESIHIGVVVGSVVGRAVDQFHLMAEITFDPFVVLVHMDDIEIQ